MYEPSFCTFFLGFFSLMSCREWMVISQNQKELQKSGGAHVLGLKTLRDLDLIRSVNKVA